MSRLTLRLPDTLHQQLIHLAESEGVSLNQYIVYALARQSSINYTIQPIPKQKTNQQQSDFTNLLQKLGTASPSEIEIALSERETVEPEKELTPEIIAKFQQRLQSKERSKR
ncbi:toxin-antitoxin system HicB family antitoxin [Pseudanabaena sp. FACHB-1277]|jgi:predicted HicB family RNase H-like nuclease|uniref:Toxin-antitoxin system HicB family antitoxin n=1 Tax=Pseudanabaena cinerea FACHB-1277 TaxID=2949581 RepID=A0A926Z737_9CYAN|nr:YlcI/YnfO family protein [Pseudanabaena cinerea]MBD2151400.1 toxin-antitoxin system HicB family antitoxin [Pseudanabaena cinerea FACHB-1277]